MVRQSQRNSNFASKMLGPFDYGREVDNSFARIFHYTLRADHIRCR
jgi:hypothetical protein